MAMQRATPLYKAPMARNISVFDPAAITLGK
jgi:hypothetical protein